MATEWISRQSGSICFTLRLCRLPMKSQAKASPQRSCLAARSCWRFSPTRVTPASASAPISSSGTYLQATRISTPRPAPRAPARGSRATFAGLDAVDQLRPPQPSPVDPDQPPWRPVRPASRRWEKKSSGSQLVQSPAASTRSTPAAASSRRRHLGQVEHAAVGDPLAEVGEGVEDLVADLVAAGADPGADRGVGGADRLGAGGDDPGGEPAPAAVEHRHARPARRARPAGSRR